SGGQKQRVAIARALASHPKVLLCDEATSALDPITTQAILELLQNINRRLGITIVVITHEMAVIRQICTHVAILDGGVVVEEGSVDDVFTHTRSAAGRRLFGFVEEHTRPPETKAPVPMLRIVFDGMRINEPIISELSLRTGIAVNILHADVNLIGEKRYGQMTIERPVNPEDAQALIRMLTEGGIAVQEVNP
ncbi:MAG: NIL domain-containing protein, partial [Christensenellales bacterium]|nr:NIL domain-containing protein [Christensenellales bacterium]